MKQDDKRAAVILSLIGIIPVIWVALKIAPAVGGGLAEMLPMFMNVFDNPFHIELCEDSLKTVLVLLLSYGMGIGIYFSTRRNYRRREEHGSAKWGEARTVNKKYTQHPKSANKLMTQNVSIGLDAKKTSPQPQHTGMRRQRCRQDTLLLQAEPHAGEYQLRRVRPERRNP